MYCTIHIVMYTTKSDVIGFCLHLQGVNVSMYMYMFMEGAMYL